MIIIALTSVGARIAGALVDVVLAVLSSKSRHTVTRIAVDTIDAGGSVTTRIAEAFVNIVLAIATRRSRLAATLVASNEVLAVSTKLARI